MSRNWAEAIASVRVAACIFGAAVRARGPGAVVTAAALRVGGVLAPARGARAPVGVDRPGRRSLMASIPTHMAAPDRPETIIVESTVVRS